MYTQASAPPIPTPGNAHVIQILQLTPVRGSMSVPGLFPGAVVHLRIHQNSSCSINRKSHEQRLMRPPYILPIHFIQLYSKTQQMMAQNDPNVPKIRTKMSPKVTKKRAIAPGQQALRDRPCPPTAPASDLSVTAMTAWIHKQSVRIYS